MRGRTAAALGAAGTSLAAFVLVMVARPGGQQVVTVVDDLGTTVTGMVAAAALAGRARLSRPAVRRSWALLAAGTFCAALGDLIWAQNELVLGRVTPFPSLADASYLLFPLFTGLGLLLHPTHRRTSRGVVRLLLDGILVAGSLFALSWLTALGAVARAGADSWLGLTVALAYPATDLVLLTVLLTAIIPSGARGRPGLATIGAALTMLTLSDSAFAYLSAVGSYTTGALLDCGFVAAYLLLALAALVASPDEGVAQPHPPPPPGWAVAVPYALCGCGVAASAASLLRGDQRLPMITSGVLVVGLLARQLVTITDNRRLLAGIAERERRLEHQALHDDLTGLANRALFGDRLSHAMTLQPREGRTIAVVFLDLDDFKLVNESLGHAVGDALLVRVAERLRAAVRPSDTVARLGGDEFAVLVEDSDAPTETAARISQSFGQPFVIGDSTVPVRASLGVAVVDAAAQPTAEELLRRAEVAVHSAKLRDRGRYVVFTPDLANVAADEFDIRDALTAAIAEGTVEVAYQPILVPYNRQLIGFEALARWQLHGTPIAPDVFLPVARRLGLIAELDELVLAKALAQLARWRTMPGRGELTCAVNADESLLDPGRALALYTGALAGYGLPPQALVVELPESHLSDSPTLATTVADLRGAGIMVALDDFGTHGSSLARLHRVPVDIVKLDRDFLRPGADAEVDEAWLGGVIELAHRLGLRVVAEGVETEQQLRTLQELGCDAVQGYLLGRPVPASQVQLTGSAVLPRQR
jgi:diguanylate cyclase (GGDEF)-like protein